MVRQFRHQLADVHDARQRAGWPEYSATEGLDKLVEAVTSLATIVLLWMGELECPHCGVEPGEDCLEWCPNRSEEE